MVKEIDGYGVGYRKVLTVNIDEGSHVRIIRFAPYKYQGTEDGCSPREKRALSDLKRLPEYDTTALHIINVRDGGQPLHVLVVDKECPEIGVTPKGKYKGSSGNSHR